MAIFFVAKFGNSWNTVYRKAYINTFHKKINTRLQLASDNVDNPKLFLKSADR